MPSPERWNETLNGLADPDPPIAAPALLREVVGERPPARRFSRLAKAIVVALIAIALMLIWSLTPLASMTDPATVRSAIRTIAAMDAAWAVVLGVFVLAGLVAFPVTLLIAATAATFGPLQGFLYAAAGALLSAAVTYGIGWGVGRRALRDLLGPRLNRIRRGIVRRGVLAIATIRLLPVAPFTLINLTAGASRIPFPDFMMGTTLGLLPGLVLMSAMGHQVFELITQPNATNILLFMGGVLAWLALSLGVQAIVTRSRRA